MKKLLSLLLAAALLLSVGVCAYAEEDEGHSHRVSDAYIIVDDQKTTRSWTCPTSSWSWTPTVTPGCCTWTPTASGWPRSAWH